MIYMKQLQWRNENSTNVVENEMYYATIGKTTDEIGVLHTGHRTVRGALPNPDGILPFSSMNSNKPVSVAHHCS